MFTGLPCWSSHLSSRSGYTHTHQCSPGCHCPVTSNQQCEPLLTFSLATNMIFFILEYVPLVMPKASYLSMECVLIPIPGYVKTSLSACTLTELTTVHYLSWNCTSVLTPQNPVLLSNHSGWTSKLHHWLEHFNFKFDFNLNQSDDVHFDHLSERTLCVTPHIGCQFMLQYFNVHAQGITNYKWEIGNFGL